MPSPLGAHRGSRSSRRPSSSRPAPPRSATLDAPGADRKGVGERRELRIRVYETAERIGGTLENAADEIQSKSPDPAIRRRAILWKADGIPALYAAAFARPPRRRPGSLASARADGALLRRGCRDGNVWRASSRSPSPPSQRCARPPSRPRPSSRPAPNSSPAGASRSRPSRAPSHRRQLHGQVDGDRRGRAVPGPAGPRYVRRRRTGGEHD